MITDSHADAHPQGGARPGANLCVRLLLLPLVLLLTAANVPAQAPKPKKLSEARVLAQAMQVAQQSRTGIEASLQKAIAEGHSTQKELDCVRAADMSFAVDAYTSAIETSLTPAEIRQALAFYASAEGRGYLQYSRSQELQRRGVPVAQPKTDLTAAELRAMTTFLGTTAGKKLLEAHVLDTPDLKTSLARGLMALTNRCGA